MTVPVTVLILGGTLAGVWLALPRRIAFRRSILIHAGRDAVWSSVRLFPALHARHSRIRSLGRIECCRLHHGDGEEAGSLWRLYGRIGDTPYWADLRILEVEPGRRIVVTLEKDSLGTHDQVSDHRVSLDLDSLSPGLTKATWTLKARLRGARIRLARVVSGKRVRALLMDGGLRSLKVAIEGQAGARGDTRRHPGERSGGADALLPPASPEPLGPTRDRRPPLNPS